MVLRRCGRRRNDANDEFKLRPFGFESQAGALS